MTLEMSYFLSCSWPVSQLSCPVLCGVPLFCVYLVVPDGNDSELFAAGLICHVQLFIPWIQECVGPAPYSCDSELRVRGVDICFTIAENVNVMLDNRSWFSGLGLARIEYGLFVLIDMLWKERGTCLHCITSGRTVICTAENSIWVAFYLRKTKQWLHIRLIQSVTTFTAFCCLLLYSAIAISFCCCWTLYFCLCFNSPYVILCGWLGSKHQLIKFVFSQYVLALM